jgi:hypothetical protein
MNGFCYVFLTSLLYTILCAKRKKVSFLKYVKSIAGNFGLFFWGYGLVICLFSPWFNDFFAQAGEKFLAIFHWCNSMATFLGNIFLALVLFVSIQLFFLKNKETRE